MTARPMAALTRVAAIGALEAALRGEAKRVTSAQTERNNALDHAAFALGQLVAGGALSEQDVRNTLIDAAAGHIADNAYGPDSLRQARLTISSGLRGGATRPRRIA